ncbi:hypothetical protein CB1_000350028 [Camelus ferus]|nr:hypothetical protein CB1_000350028 [Camelus ferus]
MAAAVLSTRLREGAGQQGEGMRLETWGRGSCQRWREGKEQGRVPTAYGQLPPQPGGQAGLEGSIDQQQRCTSQVGGLSSLWLRNLENHEYRARTQVGLPPLAALLRQGPADVHLPSQPVSCSSPRGGPPHRPKDLLLLFSCLLSRSAWSKI